jgi:MtfA peptidase
MIGVIAAAALAVAGAFIVLGPLLRRWLAHVITRERLAPLPANWARRVAELVPVFRRLSAPEQDKLLRDVRDLLTTRRWEGSGGLDLTDDMRLTIAAQACLITLGFTGDPYPFLKTILVYPSTFVPKTPFQWVRDPHAAARVPALGESWTDGAIVIAWDSAASGAADPDDGRNVVMHEFAHQLDRADGEMDGVPRLPRSRYAGWTSLFAAEFQRLVESTEAGRREVLDAYGATDPAEFFAVATEAFFERPRQLRREHPELFAALAQYYRQDPTRFTVDPDSPEAP